MYGMGSRKGRHVTRLVARSAAPCQEAAFCGPRVACYLFMTCDWGDSEMEDPLAFGELRIRSKTKAGPLEDKQLSRLGNYAHIHVI